MRLIIDFIRDLYANRFVIFQLTRRDLQNRYIGSVFGFFWHITQPLVMLGILWFVLTQIFKVGVDSNNVPFIAWLITGTVAWNLFLEALPNSVNVFQEFSYLVKKLNFKIAILPLIKINSALFTHGVFLVITIIILISSGVPISLYWFQSLYYLFSLVIFLLSLSWLLSAINVFVRDTAYFITVLLQFLYWLTPVMWRIETLPDKYHLLFKLNPLFYVINGYRDSFINQVPFWNHPALTVYYWFVMLIMLVIGVSIFRRLRLHFADVL